MTETSLPWDGEILGDCGAYSAGVWDSMMEETLLGGQAASEGVIAGVALELLPATAGTVSVTVAAGRAIVKGKYYKSTATVTVPIATPGAGHARIDRVVARSSWAAQTIRITRIPGVDDSGVPPAIVQSDGVTWDLMICQASVDDTGAIVVTDERDFIHPISPVYRRQGGNPTHWSLAGLTNYTPGRSVFQCGVVNWTGAADIEGAVVVTFPVVCTGFPVVFIVHLVDILHPKWIADHVDNLSWNDFTIDWQSLDGVTTFTSLDFMWFAVGPM